MIETLHLLRRESQVQWFICQVTGRNDKGSSSFQTFQYPENEWRLKKNSPWEKKSLSQKNVLISTGMWLGKGKMVTRLLHTSVNIGWKHPGSGRFAFSRVVHVVISIISTQRVLSLSLLRKDLCKRTVIMLYTSMHACTTVVISMRSIIHNVWLYLRGSVPTLADNWGSSNKVWVLLVYLWSVLIPELLSIMILKSTAAKL